MSETEEGLDLKYKSKYLTLGGQSKRKEEININI